MIEAAYRFGELSPEEFEAGMLRRLRISDLQVGDECTLRMSFPPISDVYTYISDYPVRIDGLREEDSHMMVAVTHLSPRDPSWKPGPSEVAFTKRGFMQFRNTGKNKLDHLPKGNVTIGYLLPAENESTEEYIERLSRSIESLSLDDRTKLIARLGATAAPRH